MLPGVCAMVRVSRVLLGGLDRQGGGVVRVRLYGGVQGLTCLEGSLLPRELTRQLGLRRSYHSLAEYGRGSFPNVVASHFLEFTSGPGEVSCILHSTTRRSPA